MVSGLGGFRGAAGATASSVDVSSATTGMSSIIFASFLKRPVMRVERWRVTLTPFAFFSVGFPSVWVTSFGTSVGAAVSVSFTGPEVAGAAVSSPA